MNWTIRDWAKKDPPQKKKKSAFSLLFFFCIVGSLIAVGFYFYPKKTSETKKVDEVKESQEGKILLPEEQIKRKSIYDRNLKLLASCLQNVSIYVKPREFINIAESVQVLAGHLELDPKKLLDELKTERSFRWLGRNIDPKKAEEIAAAVYYLGKKQGM